MVRIDESLWCDGCGAEITWGPVTLAKHQYCCQECLEGLICFCGERMDLEEDRRVTNLSQAAYSGANFPTSSYG